MELRDRIQRIALENRRYGYRRIAAQLRREGFVVNHKKLLRMMRRDNLLAVRKRRFVLTTDSNHFLPVYPNLAGRLKVDGVDQLWQSDITYIRLGEAFVYLAVVLDAYSRRVVGWRLGPTLEAELAVGALRDALESRQPAAGLVHHSDQGVQYASQAYVALLDQHGAVISMSRRGNPYDNARAESFLKTLKAEEVWLQRYRTIEQAHRSIAEFIDEIYNQRRLHSALGYRPPAEFEALAPPAPTQARNPQYEFSKA
jgi:transposase InsO family protein